MRLKSSLISLSTKWGKIQLIERLLFEVRRAGQNLNLIARRVCSTSGGRVSSEAVERAAREVARVTGEVGEALNG